MKEQPKTPKPLNDWIKVIILNQPIKSQIKKTVPRDIADFSTLIYLNLYWQYFKVITQFALNKMSNA